LERGGGGLTVGAAQDGNVLLREMQIQNPTAIMIARTAVAQDDITGCVGIRAARPLDRSLAATGVPTPPAIAGRARSVAAGYRARVCCATGELRAGLQLCACRVTHSQTPPAISQRRNHQRGATDRCASCLAAHLRLGTQHEQLSSHGAHGPRSAQASSCTRRSVTCQRGCTLA